MTNAKNIPFLMLSSMALLASCAATPNADSEKSEVSEPSSSIGESSEGDSSFYSSDSSSPDSSSEESSESVDDGSIDVIDAYYEIAKTQDAEIRFASSTSYRSETSSSRLSNITEETYSTYSDGSTTSKGTYTKKEEGKEDQIDTFNRIATKIEQTYEIDSATQEKATYDMFVSVTDYDKGIGSNSSYQDSASKVYILDKASEAGNLDEDQYILSSDFSLECSPNLTGKLADFLASNVVGNIYAEQCGVTKIKSIADETGNWNYSLAYSYSYVEDGQNVGNEIKLSYTLDSNKKKLLSYSTSSKVTYSYEGEGDEAISLYAESGSITYGEREKEIADDAIDPDDYFLEEASSVGLKAHKGFNYVDIPSESLNSGYNIPTTCTDIIGYADSKKPEKTLDASLTPSETSDSSIVALEDGEFVIKGTGTVDLTFSYYKKRAEDGVYCLTTIKAESVTVSDTKAEDIYFAYKSDMNAHLGLVAGETYSWGYSVSPAKADQAVTAVSSNPNVLGVTVSEEGTLSLEAKAKGAATITLTSVSTPEVTVSKTFYVIRNMDYAAYLPKHTFYTKNPYGTEITIKFNTDGTGTRHIVQGENSLDDTFNWEIESNELTFDFDKTPSIKEYEDGLVIGRIDSSGSFLGYGLSIASSDYSTEIYSLAD